MLYCVRNWISKSMSDYWTGWGWECEIKTCGSANCWGMRGWWHYLSKNSVFAGEVKAGVVSVLHGQTAVNIEARHEVRLAGFRIFEALDDEGWAPLGQKQELLYTLESSKEQVALFWRRKSLVIAHCPHILSIFLHCTHRSYVWNSLRRY